MNKCRWLWSSVVVLVALGAAIEQAQAQNVRLVASVLPASRAVTVNAAATAFATIINTNSTTAQNCSISIPASAGVPATFRYQTTHPQTNAVTGSPNTPVPIAAGATQTFVITVTPTAAFAERNIPLQFSCATGEVAASISGVNTFLLTSSSSATPDVVALAATTSNDGIVRTPGTTATAAFSVATVNVGVAGQVTARVEGTGGAATGVQLSLCQTNAQAQCLDTPRSSLTTNFTASQTGTFSVFVTSTGTLIPLDPASTRVFVRFSTASGSVGATSVAMQTQTVLATEGGTLKFGSVTIEAPPGSIVSGTDFRATPVSVPAVPPAGFRVLSSAFSIVLTNALGAPNSGLNAPVKVTVPYGNLGVTDPSKLTVLHYDAAAGTYLPTTIDNIDTANQTVTFDSRQFSTFALALIDAVLPQSASAANFSPNTSGFQIVNAGNAYLSPGGNCLGMSSFALWYHRLRGPGLYSRYSVADSPASVQDLIATRAHIMQSVYWNNLYSGGSSLAWQRANPAAVQVMLRAYIAFLGVPVVLIVGTPASPTAHAVLAYGYDASNILIYDPNHPGVVTTLPYNANGFGSFDGWTRFAIVTATSFGGADNFAQLAAEADGGFTSSQNINITAPAQNVTINARQTQLQGSLAGNLNPLSAAYYWQNGLPGFNQMTVTSGAFNKTIDVASGRNTIVVLAGVQAYSGQLSNTLANAAARIRIFNGQPGARFRSTLNWNQNNTDVDQYVTEPTGATSWYAGRTTAAGLTLDIDNTSGFGPENTTIEAVSTPIPGIYRIRLHYYSDHGTGQGASGRVTVTLNERAANQVGPVTKQWVIGVSNPGNDDPGLTGPDWVDIADVDVVAGTITLR